MRILFFSTIILIPGIIDCFGQNDWKPGFVIENSGDTLTGYIDFRDSRSNSMQCIFKRGMDAEAQAFRPVDLKSYRFTDGIFFISGKIKTGESEDTVFLQFLIQGKVNIYHFKDNEDRYFIEKDSALYELNNTEEI